MTPPPQDFATLPAGPDLDALIAQLVFDAGAEPAGMFGTADLSAPPCYSTTIGAAWAVVERLRDTTEDDEKFWTFTDCGTMGWRADLDYNLKPGDALVPLASGTADTLPLAIGRAALGATGVA